MGGWAGFKKISFETLKRVQGDSHKIKPYHQEDIHPPTQPPPSKGRGRRNMTSKQ
jgi:hypothetical protein